MNHVATLQSSVVFNFFILRFCHLICAFFCGGESVRNLLHYYRDGSRQKHFPKPEKFNRIDALK